MFAGSFPLDGGRGGLRRRPWPARGARRSQPLKPIGEERLLMLETIREYGLERLDQSGDKATLTQRHASFALHSPKRGTSFRSMPRRNGRRVSIAITITCAPPVNGSRTPIPSGARAGRRARLVLVHARAPRGGRQRLADALARSPASGAPRARALAAAGVLAARRGDVDEGRALLIDGIDLWRSIRRPKGACCGPRRAWLAPGIRGGRRPGRARGVRAERRGQPRAG